MVEEKMWKKEKVKVVFSPRLSGQEIGSFNP